MTVEFMSPSDDSHHVIATSFKCTKCCPRPEPSAETCKPAPVCQPVGPHRNYSRGWTNLLDLWPYAAALVGSVGLVSCCLQVQKSRKKKKAAAAAAYLEVSSESEEDDDARARN
jgi:hypothetical protein